MGDFCFFSGQIPLTADGELITGTIEEQTRQVMENMKAALAGAGLTIDDVVKTTIYLTDLGDFATVNEIYGSYFSDPAPARACVEVAGLPKGVAVEIDWIAWNGK